MAQVFTSMPVPKQRVFEFSSKAPMPMLDKYMIAHMGASSREKIEFVHYN